MCGCDLKFFFFLIQIGDSSYLLFLKITQSVYPIHPSCSKPPPCPLHLVLMWSCFWTRSPSVDWDVIGLEKMLLTLWITVRSTKLWQHWLTWQWVQQYIYHLWLCCRKSNKRQTIPFRAVTGSLWLTVHALEISAFKLHPGCCWVIDSEPLHFYSHGGVINFITVIWLK